jgi:hypothetical protein
MPGLYFAGLLFDRRKVGAHPCGRPMGQEAQDLPLPELLRRYTQGGESSYACKELQTNFTRSAGNVGFNI